MRSITCKEVVVLLQVALMGASFCKVIMSLKSCNDSHLRFFFTHTCYTSKCIGSSQKSLNSGVSVISMATGIYSQTLKHGDCFYRYLSLSYSQHWINVLRMEPSCFNMTAHQFTKRGPWRRGWTSLVWRNTTDLSQTDQMFGINWSRTWKPSLLVWHQCVTSKICSWKNGGAEKNPVNIILNLMKSLPGNAEAGIAAKG